MGSVVKMRSVRAVLLAIIATVVLAGGLASTAYAHDGPDTANISDPGDPGLPPD